MSDAKPTRPLTPSSAPGPALDAFADAFAERREAIVDRLVEEAAGGLGGALGAAPEVFRGDRAQEVDDAIEALRSAHPQEEAERWARWIERGLSRGQSTRTLQAIHGAMRRVFVDEGLSLHAAGVPRATAGIRRLVRSSSEALYLIDEALRARAEQARRKAQIFESLVHNAPDAIGVAHLDGTVIYVNPAFDRMLGGKNVIGLKIFDLVTPESAAIQREVALKSLFEQGMWTGELTYMRGDGSTFDARVTAFVVRDERGQIIARGAFMRDLTEARRAEEERRRLAAEVIATQKQALEELGTPLVPIAEGVLVMPLVGVLDTARAERMLGVLLEGIGHEDAKVVILDLTGVKEAGAEAAAALVQAANAARLLGAEVVSTGMGPELSRTFVEVGADLGAIVTRGTLRDGVSYAMRAVRRA